MWLPNHNNSAKETRHMEENTLIGFVKPGTISDPLTELLRMGARKLIEAGIQSGRRGPSLSPTPLGTGLETFASSGSGHSKPWLMSHSRSFTTIRLEFRRGSARMP